MLYSFKTLCYLFILYAEVHGAGDPEGGGVRREGRHLLVRCQPVPRAERWGDAEDQLRPDGLLEEG